MIDTYYWNIYINFDISHPKSVYDNDCHTQSLDEKYQNLYNYDNILNI